MAVLAFHICLDLRPSPTLPDVPRTLKLKICNLRLSSFNLFRQHGSLGSEIPRDVVEGSSDFFGSTPRHANHDPSADLQQLHDSVPVMQNTILHVSASLRLLWHARIRPTYSHSSEVLPTLEKVKVKVICWRATAVKEQSVRKGAPGGSLCCSFGAEVCQDAPRRVQDVNDIPAPLIPRILNLPFKLQSSGKQREQSKQSTQKQQRRRRLKCSAVSHLRKATCVSSHFHLQGVCPALYTTSYKYVRHATISVWAGESWQQRWAESGRGCTFLLRFPRQLFVEEVVDSEWVSAARKDAILRDPSTL